MRVPARSRGTPPGPVAGRSRATMRPSARATAVRRTGPLTGRAPARARTVRRPPRARPSARRARRSPRDTGRSAHEAVDQVGAQAELLVVLLSDPDVVVH